MISPPLPFTSAPEKTLISRHIQPKPPSFSYPVPAANLRLTAEDWKLILEALKAYQHNQTYRPLYQKLVAQTF